MTRKILHLKQVPTLRSAPWSPLLPLTHYGTEAPSHTVDGRTASAEISSTQNADKPWTMTAVTNTSIPNGKTAEAVTLSLICRYTLMLTGSKYNEPFFVDNVQVTRGIGADVAGTDVATFETASAGLSLLDTAVALINMKRAELGATTNRPKYASDNMASVSMNA